MKKVIAIMLLSVMLTACTGVGSDEATETTVHVCTSCANCETSSGEDEPDVTETVATTISEPVEVSEPVETTETHEVLPYEVAWLFDEGKRAYDVAYNATMAYLRYDEETLIPYMIGRYEAFAYFSHGEWEVWREAGLEYGYSYEEMPYWTEKDVDDIEIKIMYPTMYLSSNRAWFEFNVNIDSHRNFKYKHLRIRVYVAKEAVMPMEYGEWSVNYFELIYQM
ncbi:MAG: hypothetical protein FWD34_10760 [Oscillospiraceae bacterium]|nr:hypothetical protein [Oscillospiraceae bacterium]